jgi:hypothetical protein
MEILSRQKPCGRIRRGGSKRSPDASLFVSGLAQWQSGYAADCKSVYVGSIPACASNKFTNPALSHPGRSAHTALRRAPANVRFRYRSVRSQAPAFRARSGSRFPDATAASIHKPGGRYLLGNGHKRLFGIPAEHEPLMARRLLRPSSLVPNTVAIAHKAALLGPSRKRHLRFFRPRSCA